MWKYGQIRNVCMHMHRVLEGDGRWWWALNWCTNQLEGWCQGMSKTGSILDIWVLAELQQIYEGSLKGNMSWLND